MPKIGLRAAFRNLNPETRIILCFLAGWTLLNLLNGLFLDVNLDEAYYLYCSQKLQWGYFDHPPVIVVLIKMGYWLIPNELGPRLPSVLMSTMSLWLLWKLSESGNARLFLKIVVSILAVQVMGFHGLPEVPLIFFCLLYLYFLKKYLASDSYYLVLPLSLSIALMFLSKYSAILIPPATLLCAPFLMKRKSFWLIVVLSVVFLMPHILWQIETNYMSLRFHLLDRNFEYVYSVKKSLKFIGMQPLIAGPFIGFILFYLAVKHRSENTFEKVLKSTLWIYYGFFLLTTLRGRVLNHWTTLAVVPLVLLALKHLERTPGLLTKWQKALNATFIASVILFAGFRLFLAVELIPHQVIKTEYLHGFRGWAGNLQTAAKGCPIVFVDTWEQPARYMFYTHEYAHCLGTIPYRRCHFDFTDDHRALFDKRVLLIHDGELVLEPGNGKKYFGEFVDHFATYPGIQLTPEKMEYSFGKDARDVSIPLKVTRNPYRDDELGISRAVLGYGIFNKNGIRIREGESEIQLKELVHAKGWTAASFKMPADAEGTCYVRFGLRCGQLPATLNSESIKVKEVR
jgi:hypothetical protein